MSEREVKVNLTGNAHELVKAFEEGGTAAGSFGGALKLIESAGPLVALAAIGGGLFELGEKFEKATDIIRRDTGASGEALKALEEVSNKVYASVPNSLTAVAEAVGGLSSKLHLTGEPLEKMSTQLLNISHLTKTDVVANVKLASDAMQSWGVSAEAMGGKLDYAYSVAQKHGRTVQDVIEKTTAAGPALRAFGFSFEESANAMAAWSEKGVDVGRVTTALSRIVLGDAKELKGAQDEVAKATANLAKVQADYATKSVELSARVKDAEKSAAQTAVDGARNIRDAYKSVADSKEALVRTERDGAQKIVDAGKQIDDARRAEARTAKDEAQKIVDARKALVDAEKAVGDVARVEARKVVDANRTVVDAEKAVGEVAATEARKIGDAKRNVADAIRAEAQVAVDEARRVSDAERGAARSTEDAAIRVKEVKERTDDAIFDAHKQVMLATDALNDAVGKGDKPEQIEAASQRVEDAKLHEARTLRDAGEQVTKSLVDQSRVQVDSTEKVAVAQETAAAAVVAAAARTSKAHDAETLAGEAAAKANEAALGRLAKAQESATTVAEAATKANEAAAARVSKAQDGVAKATEAASLANVAAHDRTVKAQENLAKVTEAASLANVAAQDRVAKAQESAARASESAARANESAAKTVTAALAAQAQEHDKLTAAQDRLKTAEESLNTIRKDSAGILNIGKEKLTDFIKAVQGAKTDQEALLIGSALLGKKLTIDAVDAFRTVGLSADDLTKVLVNTHGAISEQEKASTHAHEQMAIAMHKAEVAMAPAAAAVVELAGKLAGVLGPAIEDVRKVLDPIVNWIENHSAASLGAFGVSIGLLGVAFGIAFAPLTLLTAAIATFVAIGIGIDKLYTHVDAFRVAVDASWQGLQTAFNWVKDHIEAIGKIIAVVMLGPIALFAGAIADMITKVGGFKTVITEIGGWLKDTFTPVISTLVGWFKDWVWPAIKLGYAAEVLAPFNAVKAVLDWIMNKFSWPTPPAWLKDIGNFAGLGGIPTGLGGAVAASNINKIGQTAGASGTPVVSSGPVSGAHAGFFNSIMAAAQAAAAATGVPLPVILAQAANETNYGTSQTYKTKNNPGGIGGLNNYKSFGNIGEGFMGLAELIKKLAPGAVGASTDAAFRALGQSGWADGHYRVGSSGSEFVTRAATSTTDKYGGVLGTEGMALKNFLPSGYKGGGASPPNANPVMGAAHPRTTQKTTQTGGYGGGGGGSSDGSGDLCTCPDGCTITAHLDTAEASTKADDLNAKILETVASHPEIKITAETSDAHTKTSALEAKIREVAASHPEIKVTMDKRGHDVGAAQIDTWTAAYKQAQTGIRDIGIESAMLKHAALTGAGNEHVVPLTGLRQIGSTLAEEKYRILHDGKMSHAEKVVALRDIKTAAALAKYAELHTHNGKHTLTTTGIRLIGDELAKEKYRLLEVSRQTHNKNTAPGEAKRDIDHSAAMRKIKELKDAADAFQVPKNSVWTVTGSWAGEGARNGAGPAPGTTGAPGGGPGVSVNAINPGEPGYVDPSLTVAGYNGAPAPAAPPPPPPIDPALTTAGYPALGVGGFVTGAGWARVFEGGTHELIIHADGTITAGNREQLRYMAAGETVIPVSTMFPAGTARLPLPAPLAPNFSGQLASLGFGGGGTAGSPEFGGLFTSGGGGAGGASLAAQGSGSVQDGSEVGGRRYDPSVHVHLHPGSVNVQGHVLDGSALARQLGRELTGHIVDEMSRLRRTGDLVPSLGIS